MASYSLYSKTVLNTKSYCVTSLTLQWVPGSPRVKAEVLTAVYRDVDLAPVLFWPHFCSTFPPLACFLPAVALLLPFPDHPASVARGDLTRAVLWTSLSSLRLCSLTSFRSSLRWHYLSEVILSHVITNLHMLNFLFILLLYFSSEHSSPS